MADEFVNFDPFATKVKSNGAFAPIATATQPAAQATGGKDEFVNFDPFAGTPSANTGTGIGALTRGAIGGAAPGLLGVLPGAAAGAELGAAGGPWVSLAGGIAGAYLGAEGIQTAQNWVLNKVPKLRDLLGQSEEQKRRDEAEHPLASFLGGILPFAVTMSPMSVGKDLLRKLPENATAWQRISANPLTARLFSGGIMGGMELGQEAASEDKVNWNRVAIATGFGLIFNKPNTIGQAISEYGGRPMRYILGRPSPMVEGVPTVAMVNDEVHAGPGGTEDTFMRSAGRNDTAEQAAFRERGIERSILDPPRLDFENVARRQDPELFKEYDDLLARRQAFKSWIDSQNEPKPFQFLEIEEKRAALEKELADHIAQQKGYAGGARARKLRAQIRELEAEHKDLTERAEAFKAGTAVETPDIAIARQHLVNTEFRLRELQPRIRQANVAAAKLTDTPTVAAPPEEVAAPPPAPTAETPAGAPVEGAAAEAAAPPRPGLTVEVQKAFIENHWAQQLIAAGVPQEQAIASGRLMAIKYAADASHLAGAKGNAREVYLAEAPRIVSGGPRGPAVVTPPPIPTTAAELRAYLAAGGKVAAGTKEGVPLPAAIAATAERASVTPPPLPSTREELRAYLEAGGRIQPATMGGVPIGVPTAEGTPFTPPPPPVHPGTPEWQPSTLAPTPVTGIEKPAAAPAAEWKPTNFGTEQFVRGAFKADVWQDQHKQWHWAANDLREGTGRFIKGGKYPTEMKAKQAAVDMIESEYAKAPEAVPAKEEEPLPPIIEMKKRAPRGPAAKDPENYSLFEALAKAGGLKDEPDTRAIFSGRNPFVPGFGRLIRPGGRSMDRAVEFAVENGYIARPEEGQPHVMPEDLRQLLDTEDRGTKQYKLGKAPPEKAADLAEQRHRIESAIDTAIERDGVDPKSVSGEIRDRMVEIMEKEGVHDPLEAWTQADLEVERRAYEAGEIESKSENVPGWDVEFPSETGPAPAAGEAAPPRGEQPEGAEIGGPARPPGGGAREPAEATDPLAHLSDEDIANFFQGPQQRRKGSIDLSVMPPEMRLTKYWDESTLIHEPAHAWLEQMMRDAQHPAAPAWLVQDANTVIRELGIRSADTLLEKTARGRPTARAREAHEKFARAFERYMYEGVAPSPEAAGVFERFKNWLLRIYGEIRGLADKGLTEISPHMRAVFDRMLTETPQETAVGPHRERGPTLAEIHEGDVRATEPAEAEPAADRIATEGARYVEEQPEQIKAELEAAAKAAGFETARPAGEGVKPAGEGEPIPSRPSEVVGDRGAAQPITPGGGGGEERGQILKGGTDTRPESTTLSGTGQRAGEREQPLAPGPPPDTIPQPKGRALDSEWNIDPNKITSVPEAVDSMLEAAANNNYYWANRGLPTTKEALWNLAIQLGQNPATMDLEKFELHIGNLLGGMKDMAPKVLAARMLAQNTALAVADANRAYSLEKTPENMAKFAEAVMRQDMILSALSGGYASWGRTGSALHDMSGVPWNSKDAEAVNAILKKNTGRTLFQLDQLSKLLSKYDQTQQIASLVRDSAIHPWRVLVEIWINGLISGLQTHLTYLSATLGFALERVGPETAAAAAMGKLRQALGREGETVRFGEVTAGLKGLWRGLAPASLSSIEAAQRGTQTLLPGQRAQDRPLVPYIQQGVSFTPAVLNQAATWHDVVGSLFGAIRGLRTGVVAGDLLQKAASEPGAPLIQFQKSMTGETPDVVMGGRVIPTGAIARWPSRMMTALHSFYLPLNYSAKIHELAYRDGVNRGLAGADLDSHIASFVQKPPKEALEEAHDVANRMSLMDAGGEWTKNLSRLVNTEFFGTKDPMTGKTMPGTGLPILKFVDPFIHISTAIIQRGIVERTPIGLLSLIGKDSKLGRDLLGHNGPVAADIAAGRMLVGTALSVLFGSLAAEGLVAGSEPTNREEAAVWRQVYQAHSIRIGDTWYAMNRLGPMGMLLSTAADLYQVAHKAEEGEFTQAATALMHAISQNILDESFMRGPSDLIKAVEDPGRYGDSYVRNFVTSFVPFSVALSQMARQTDPYSRQARTMVDALRAKIPGLSEDLLPRRDVWGEPLPNRTGLGGSMTAIWEQKINEDPVNKALLAHSLHPAAVGRSIRNVQLTDEQYDDYARLAGRLAKLRMDAIVRSPAYAGMNPGLQHDLIVEQLRQSREVARNMMFMKYPSLLVDARNIKMQRRMATEELP